MRRPCTGPLPDRRARPRRVGGKVIAAFAAACERLGLPPTDNDLLVVDTGSEREHSFREHFGSRGGAAGDGWHPDSSGTSETMWGLGKAAVLDDADLCAAAWIVLFLRAMGDDLVDAQWKPAWPWVAPRLPHVEGQRLHTESYEVRLAVERLGLAQMCSRADERVLNSPDFASVRSLASSLFQWHWATTCVLPWLTDPCGWLAFPANTTTGFATYVAHERRVARSLLGADRLHVNRHLYSRIKDGRP
jgi:hypothetical protein